MIRLGDLYQDEDRPRGALLVRAIRCPVHGDVAGARLVLGQNTDTIPGLLFCEVRMTMNCPHCSEVVAVTVARVEKPGAIADLPMVPRR